MFSSLPKLQALDSRSVFARNWKVLEDFEYRIDSISLRWDFLYEIDKLNAWHDFTNFEIEPANATTFHSIRILEGTITDLASIPRFFWWFMSPTDFIRPSTVHDELYEFLRLLRSHGKDVRKLRKIVDLILYESLKYVRPEKLRKGSWWQKCRNRIIRSYLWTKHLIAYFAVRLFGWTTIRSARIVR